MSNRRTWVLAAVGAVVVTAGTVVAVSVATDDEPSRTSGGPASESPEPTGSPTDPPSQSPSASPSTSPSTSPSASPLAPTRTLPVYYVGDTPSGPRLFREFHRVEVGDGEASSVSAALAQAMGDTALDPDYRSAWPAGTTVSAVTVDGPDAADVVWVDVANDEVDLHDRPADLTEAEAAMAVEQLVHTTHGVLQRRPPVQLMLGGERTDTLLGVPVSEPLAAGDPMQVQGTVWVVAPQHGDSVGTTFTVEGRGAFFEATVSWQLLRDGDVVDEGFATAEEGNTLAPYRFEVTAEPGDYVLRVYDADMSGGEGGGEAEDTKAITVRG